MKSCHCHDSQVLQRGSGVFKEAKLAEYTLHSDCVSVTVHGGVLHLSRVMTVALGRRRMREGEASAWGMLAESRAEWGAKPGASD